MTSAFGRNALRGLAELRPARGDARVNGIWPVVITTLAFIGSVSESFGQQKIYWTHNDVGDHKIQRADLDGGNVEDFLLADHPMALDLDLLSGKLYWGGGAPASGFHCVGFDGTPCGDLRFGCDDPSGFCVLSVMALDLLDQRIYWTQTGGFDFDRGLIRRAKLDGTNAETILEIGRSLGIALDLHARKVYWTEGELFGFDGRILRADLDGSNVEELLPTRRGPLGIALDVAAGKMYWGEPGVGIQRASLDGSDVEDLGVGALGGRPWGVSLHLPAKKIYVAGLNLARMNLDGSGLEILLPNVKAEAGPGIALDLCGRPVGGLRFPDHVAFVDCLTGPASFAPTTCYCSDFSGDARVDLKDYALLQRTFTSD